MKEEEEVRRIRMAAMRPMLQWELWLPPFLVLRAAMATSLMEEEESLR